MNISEYSKVNINSTTQPAQSLSENNNVTESGESFKDFLKEKPADEANKSNTNYDGVKTDKAKENYSDKKDENQKEETDKVANKNIEANLMQMNIAMTNKDLINVRQSLSVKKDSKNIDSFRLDISKMNKNDIDFLKQVIDGKEISFNGISPDLSRIEVKTSDDTFGKVYKTQDISKGVFEIVDKAYNTQKPVRLDFDANSSVILKVDKEGKLSAEFISSDKTMAQAIQSNLSVLKSRLDEQNLPYKDISYRNNERGGNNQNKNQNNKNKNNGG